MERIDRGTGSDGSGTGRRVVVLLGWLSLAALVALSGCTTAVDVTPSTTPPVDQETAPSPTAAATTDDTENPATAADTENSSPGPTRTGATTATPTAAASSTTAGSPTPTPTASPTPTATPTDTSTATPAGEDLSQAEARQAFVSTIEAEGIAVNRLELADSVWMLVYTTESTSWGGFADEMETITLAYCGLFERGLPMGFDGSDNLEMTVLDESGTAPAIGGWYVDPYVMCQPYNDGELTERELMAKVFDTLRIDESN